MLWQPWAEQTNEHIKQKELNMVDGTGIEIEGRRRSGPQRIRQWGGLSTQWT